ncbi:Rve domain containing hypothetical protein [Phytophthora palmivora]|uniref:Integrase catalytic domain-containing protein n=1 Tax=Phytophthora palmivora TaxID=4796 RepID=A0A2P4Y8X9_9STRA|nr:Rve domain containing hypothetical protein [Phytophthora palmivora]
MQPLYLLRKKSDAEGHLEDLHNKVVKVIRSDGGVEFGSNHLERFLLSRGIEHQITEAGMSSSNGKAGRFHRTVMDSARAIFWASVLPQRFWGNEVLYANYN